MLKSYPLSSTREWISARKALHIIAMFPGDSVKAVLAPSGVCPRLLPITCCRAVHYRSLSCSTRLLAETVTELLCNFSLTNGTRLALTSAGISVESSRTLGGLGTYGFPFLKRNYSCTETKIYGRNISRINMSDQVENHDFELLLNYIKPSKFT